MSHFRVNSEEKSPTIILTFFLTVVKDQKTCIRFRFHSDQHEQWQYEYRIMMPYHESMIHSCQKGENLWRLQGKGKMKEIGQMKSLKIESFMTSLCICGCV